MCIRDRGESPQDALIREFREEVGIEIASSEHFMVLEHNYPDRHVRLHVQIVKKFVGHVSSMEGQALKWLALSDLESVDFLQGNQAIVEKLVECQKI